jgi:glycosyltransferase involved in cell wall biosynthesis
MATNCKNPEVSVIIPTYNRAYCIERALRSVLNQTYNNFRVLVIDDGSTDNTSEVVRDYVLKDRRIKYEYIENSGVSEARNTGIRLSYTELVAFLDSDDEWLAEKLQTQIALYEDKPFKLCHTDEIWIRNGIRVNQMKKHEKSGGRIFQKCLPLCCISPSSVLIHRSVFGELGLFKESFEVCEDYDLWLRICARYEVDYIDKPLIIKYGGHKDQLSKKKWGNDEFRVRAISDIIESGILSGEDLTAAYNMLIKKSEILYKGFSKHNNTDKARYYLEHYLHAKHYLIRH